MFSSIHNTTSIINYYALLIISYGIWFYNSALKRYGFGCPKRIDAIIARIIIGGAYILAQHTKEANCRRITMLVEEGLFVCVQGMNANAGWAYWRSSSLSSLWRGHIPKATTIYTPNVAQGWAIRNNKPAGGRNCERASKRRVLIRLWHRFWNDFSSSVGWHNILITMGSRI